MYAYEVCKYNQYNKSIKRVAGKVRTCGSCVRFVLLICVHSSKQIHTNMIHAKKIQSKKTTLSKKKKIIQIIFTRSNGGCNTIKVHRQVVLNGNSSRMIVRAAANNRVKQHFSNTLCRILYTCALNGHGSAGKKDEPILHRTGPPVVPSKHHINNCIRVLVIDRDMRRYPDLVQQQQQRRVLCSC